MDLYPAYQFERSSISLHRDAHQPILPVGMGEGSSIQSRGYPFLFPIGRSSQRIGVVALFPAEFEKEIIADSTTAREGGDS
jgi:hypothetical protein